MTPVATAPKPAQDRQALLQIARAIMQERDLGRLLGFIMQSATELLAAERSTLFLIDTKTQELWSRVAQGAEVREIRLPIGTGIAGCVARTRETINIPDAYADPRFNQATDRKTGYHTRSILCLPLFDRANDPLGVLQVLNKRCGVFTAADEELLTALSSLASVAIENAQLYEETKRVFKSLVQALAAAIDARDPATAGHSERVAYYSLRMAQAAAMPPEQLELLEYAAHLHDVGKIGVRDAVLLKEGRLTDEEFAQIRSHVAHTREILAKIRLSQDLLELPQIAAAHHEKLDGTGYPAGLRGDQIPLLARMIAIADVYDALVAHDRPYKKAMPVEQALAILEKGAGTHFDAQLVRLFIDRRLYDLKRRQRIRFGTHLVVHYRIVEAGSETAPHEAVTGDISATGMLFRAPESLPIGATLHLALALADEEFEAFGQVSRVAGDNDGQDYEIGVRLVNLPQHLAVRLQRLLEKQVGVQETTAPPTGGH